MARPKRPRSSLGSYQTAFLPFVPVQTRTLLHPKCTFLHNRSRVCQEDIRSAARKGRIELEMRSVKIQHCKPNFEHEGAEKSDMYGNPGQDAFQSAQSLSELKTAESQGPKKDKRKRVVSEETRQKIAIAMIGQPRSEEMRAKVSQKMKGRVPWNKGKKLSPETRARMSEARVGRIAWNKGRRLSEQHRQAISRSAMSKVVTEETKYKMRMARRRPGDAIVGGTGGAAKTASGSYPLVESEGINEYITLRRELRVWSDKFMTRNSRRPSLADVRRTASKSVMRKFERYVEMRDHIRGLATDVYGSVNPAAVPVAPAGDAANSPRNNNARRIIRVTKHGNRRLIEGDEAETEGRLYAAGNDGLAGAQEDMWDMYDRPSSHTVDSSNSEEENSLFGTHELGERKGKLTANDYRLIGKYRLMESIDIHRYVALRKELERWSAVFKQRFGRTPTLSDARSRGKSTLYNRFCEYLNMRDRMSGLVNEVYGTELDDMETLKQVNNKGKIILDTLRGGGAISDNAPSGQVRIHAIPQRRGKP